MELDDLLKGLLGDLHKISQSDSVVGKPIQFGGANLVPLCRVTVGFGTGVTDLRGSGSKRDGAFDAGGAAGGLMIEPRAFVVVGQDGIPELLSMKRGGAVVARGLELPVHASASAAPAPAPKKLPAK